MNAILPRALHGEILSPGATFRVYARTHAIAGRRLELELEAGLSIDEVLLRIRGEWRGGYAVYLGASPIEPRNFGRIRVKAGAIVTVVPLLEGGGSGSVWQSVLGIVIAVAALAVAPWAVGLLGLTGVAASIGTALVAGGIMLAGTMLLNALFPVRPADSVTSSSINSIQGAQNQDNKFGAVPVVLGKSRQSPFYAAKPYTEISGDDQYLRMVFCLGYGPLQIDAMQIGETPLSSFSGVQVEVRQGFAGDAPITLYKSQVDETDLSITLDDFVDQPLANGGGGAWTSQFTVPDTETISLDFTAPNGMSATDPSGANIAWNAVVNVQYRRVGDVAFIAAGDVVFPNSFNPVREGLVISVASGQYEVRARRATGNGQPPYGRDQVVWTAIRSFKSGSPISFPKPLALVALRILATDQLSGVVNTFNCITTSLLLSYSGSGDVWNLTTPTQNPADEFRYVLQGPANARPVPDGQINLSNLQAWWIYCTANGFKYNEVVTSAGSVYDKLCDIAAAGRAVPTFIDGQWAVVWDRPSDPIVQHFTPRNSWGMQGQRAYAQQPHGWRVQFINEKNGYTQDERIVYDDGYSALNATLFETIQFPGVTDPDLVWRMGRFQIAQARLRPEKITLNVGWEHLICTRGDRVRVTHDVLLIGLGAARVKSVAGQVVTFDEVLTIETGKTYGVSFRIPDDVRVQTNAVDPSITAGEYTALTLVGDLSLITAGTLAAFGLTAQESADYRVQAIAHQKDLVASLTLVDDAPAISTADQGAIPAYTPNVTIPADPFTLPPRNLQLTQLIDGSGQGVRALVQLAWQVPRFGKIASFQVQRRDDNAGAGDWQTVDSVLPPLTVSSTVLPNSGIWSYRVRCLFTDGTASAFAELDTVKLDGLSIAPSPVTNLRNTFIAGRSFMSWDQAVDPRVILVEIRKGSTFLSAQIVDDAAVSPWQTVGDDTYWVTTYVNSPFGVRVYATSASLALSGSIEPDNVIVSHDEKAEGWTGSFIGAVGIDTGNNALRTAGNDDFLSRSNFLTTADFLDGDGTLSGGGFYWSSHVVDVGGVAYCRVSNSWTATGVPADDDFLGNADFLSNLDFLKASLSQYVRVRPIILVSQVGPTPTWGPTQIWSPDVYLGRMFQLGVQFEILDATQGAFAYLLSWSWSIDVPDRLDSYQHLTVPVGGLPITFKPTGSAVAVPFNGGVNNEALPHLTPSIQTPNAGDRIVWSSLTTAGVTLKVMNGASDVGGTNVNLLVRGY